MARTHPPLDQIRPTTAGAYTEREVVTALSHGLDDRFHLFHGVEWAATGGSTRGSSDRHGELDLVIVEVSGDVTLVEINAGPMNNDERMCRNDAAVQITRSPGEPVDAYRFIP